MRLAIVASLLLSACSAKPLPPLAPLDHPAMVCIPTVTTDNETVLLCIPVMEQPHGAKA